MTRESARYLDGAGAAEVEVFVLFADERGIRRLRIDGAETLRLPLRGAHPTEQVAKAVAERGLTPRFVHSTSWRYEGGALMLTYVAVVDPPDGAEGAPVSLAPIACTGPTTPPSAIAPEQVLAHTLRHLAWLTEHDPVAREALAGWAPYLRDHRPEPFRALGSPA